MNVDQDLTSEQYATRGGEQFSPLRVWLHPFASAEKLRVLAGKPDSAEKISEMKEEEAQKLREENQRLATLLAESENARSSLESRLAQMTDDETYQKEMDARFAEIEREFQKVEAMKQRYEATIGMLREKLRSSNEELRRLSGQSRSGSAISLFDEEDPEPDPDTERKTPEPLLPQPQPRRRTRPSATRPTSPTPPTPPRHTETRPSRPATRHDTPFAPRDSDWLSPLPDKV